MGNLRNIQFLRNATPLPSLKAVKTALETQAASVVDGSAILGRYTVQTGGSASDTEVRTIMALVYNHTVSFIMNDKEIDNVVSQLDYSGITTSDAAVVTNVTEADGVVSASSANVGSLKLTDYTKGFDSGNVAATDSINEAVAKLENQIDAEEDARIAKFAASSAATVANENKVVTDVTQTDGKIAATVSNITSVKLDGYAEGSDADIASTDTLGEALGKLQAQINAMDKNADAVDGQVVTTVAEADGKVTETKANVKDLQLGGYAKTNDTGDIASADTINVALSKLENKAAAITIGNDDGSINVTTAATGTDINVNIKSGDHVLAKDGGNGVYTDIAVSAVTGAELAGLGANVREAYKLVGTDGSRLGEYVKVYKDQTLSGVDYTNQVMTFHYILADGSTTAISMDMSDLIQEQEVENGIQQINHKLSIKLDTNGDDTGEGKFLTVGANGLKLDGVTDAISAAVESLDATVSAETTSKHVSVKIDEADGKLTAVTISDSDIASASALTQEISDRQAGDTELSNRLGTGVTTANTATAQLTALSGTSADGSGVTSVWGAKAYTDDKVAAIVSDLDADVSGNSTHVTVNVVEEDGVITDVNVAEDNIANADDLATLSAKTVTAITSANGSITANIDDAVDNKTYNIETTAGQISGLTVYASADKGAAKISGVAASDSVQTAVDNLYKSIASEIDARKAAIAARTISGDNAISVTETANGDGFGTQISLVLDDSTIGTGTEGTGDYNALSVTNDGLFLSTTWECGTF